MQPLVFHRYLYATEAGQAAARKNNTVERMGNSWLTPADTVEKTADRLKPVTQEKEQAEACVTSACRFFMPRS